MLYFNEFWMIISWLGNVPSGNQPESEPQKYWSDRFSIAFHLLLPVAGLGFLLFGKKHIFPQLLVQIDRNCVSVLCPSLSKREKLLKWACQRLPTKWSSHSSKTLSGGVADLWSDGSLLCTLINTAIPGACPNPHRHWKQPPSHAQAIAFKYLGVVPTFSENDLAGNFTSHFERAFIYYLCEIQNSINKITETTDAERIFCSEYIARGLGLFSGVQHQETVFYVYPDDFENSEPSENSVIINIKGPYGTYGHATISNIQNKPERRPDGEDNNTSNSNDPKTSGEFFKEKFSWFSNLTAKPDVKNKCIEIDVVLEKNRAKVSYIPNNYGMHEINLICNGELLKGSPFNVHIFSNKVETDDNLETGDKVGLRHYQKRKIISEMVDLIDEEVPFSQLEGKCNVTERYDAEEIIKNDEITKNDNVYEPVEGEIENRYDEIVKETMNEVHGTEYQRLNDLNQSWEPDFNVEVQMAVIEEADEAPEVNDNLDKRNEKSVFTSEKKIDIAIETEHTQNSREKTQQDEKFEFNDIDSKPKMSTTDNLKENKYDDDSMFNNNKVNIEYQLGLEDTKRNCQIVSKYINANINKVKIPVKFLENEKKVRNKMDIVPADIEYFQKAHPTMTNIEREKYEDLNNKKLYTENTESVQFGALDQREMNDTLFQQQEHLKPPLPANAKDTSSICPDHIVHEVEYSRMSVAEKTKIFARNAVNSKHSSKHSSFSENESVEGSANDRHHQTVGLSVLNVLDSLKKSVHITKGERFSFSSTVSLPNISLESDHLPSNVVKDRKTYWERFSMSSSMSSRSLSPKKASGKDEMCDDERNRLIWRKPDAQGGTKTGYPEKGVSKSADDILAVTESLDRQHSESVDDCLDDFEILTIDERKRILLKQNYEEEKLAKQRKMLLKKQSVSLQDMRKTEQLRPKADLMKNLSSVSPVVEKIRKFNSVSNLKVVEEENKKNIKATTYNNKDYHRMRVVIPEFNEKIDSNNDSLKPEPKIRYRSQFNRAIRYFRKLEEKSQVKTKSKISKKSKQFSLDIRPKKDNKRRRGGSLNISERFSIDNLYEDITKNKKGSFRGTPNRTALVEALATFSRKENIYNNGNENDIKYDMFKNLGPIKKRKSLKCIFDVYY